MIYELLLIGLAGLLAGYSYRAAFVDSRLDYWLQFGGSLIAILLLADGVIMKDIAYQKAFNDAAVLISTQYACVNRSNIVGYTTLPTGQRIPLIRTNSSTQEGKYSIFG